MDHSVIAVWRQDGKFVIAKEYDNPNELTLEDMFDRIYPEIFGYNNDIVFVKDKKNFRAAKMDPAAGPIKLQVFYARDYYRD